MQVRACACTRVTGPAAIQFVRHTAQSNVYHPSRTLGSDRRDLRGALFSEDDQNTSTTIVLLIYNVSFKLLFLFFFSLPHCRVIAHISHAVLIQATLLQAIVRNCPWRWRRA